MASAAPGDVGGKRYRNFLIGQLVFAELPVQEKEEAKESARLTDHSL